MVRDVGAGFLMIQHRRDPRQMAQRAVQPLQNASARLVGVVVNKVALSRADTYFCYHQQYEDYLR